MDNVKHGHDKNLWHRSWMLLRHLRRSIEKPDHASPFASRATGRRGPSVLSQKMILVVPNADRGDRHRGYSVCALVKMDENDSARTLLVADSQEDCQQWVTRPSDDHQEARDDSAHRDKYLP